jgi:hypothetical protein
MEDNPDHLQAYHLLAPLVANNPEDPEVKKRAILWLEVNPGHLQAYQLLASLVANHPEDPEVKKRATQWLEENRDHTNRSHLLKTLIARCQGDEEWLDRGMAYLQEPGTKHHQNIVAALLTGSGAAPPYVELALDYLQSLARGQHKAFILVKLTQALAHNPENAFACLQGGLPDDRKKTICRSIALVFDRYPANAPDFLAAWPDALPAEHQALILVNLLLDKVDLPETDRFLADWLDKHYLGPGYGTVLQALQHSADTKTRLTYSNMLAADVLQDLKKLQPQGKRK